VALSLAMTPAVASRLDYVAVPAERHEPLVQGMALLPGASDDARAFFAFLQGREARAILAAQGFDIPSGG
jgi:molybdate transport system substrate-binding protein